MLLYELWCGGKRWRRVLPFAAVAVWFSAQALMHDGALGDHAHNLRFTPQALWETLAFCSSRVFLAPLAGLLLIPALVLAKDRRVKLGIAGAAALMGPLWFLPGRLFAVYLYVPLIALAIAAATAADKLKPAWIAAFFAVWIPVNYMGLRQERKAALAAAGENRAYVAAVGEFAAGNPKLRNVIYEGQPSRMSPWGVEGALKWFYRAGDLRLAGAASEQAAALYEQRDMAVVTWGPITRRLIVARRSPDSPEVSMMTMEPGASVWLLGEGWYPQEGGFRWCQPVATAKLYRPANARYLELRLNVGPQQFRAQGGVRFSEQGWRSHRWRLPEAREGLLNIELRFPAPYQPSNGDPRTLGGAVAGFGFVE